MAIDWLNGCRTPLMDGRLSGGIRRINFAAPDREQLYRA